MKITLHSDVRGHNIMQTIVWHEFRCVLVGNGEEGVRTIVTIVMAVLMFTPSVLLLFNVNDAGPNVNGVFFASRRVC